MIVSSLLFLGLFMCFESLSFTPHSNVDCVETPTKKIASVSLY